MNVLSTARPTSSSSKPAEHFDVLIIGAGISGIGSAYHLSTQLPGASFAILEAQESFGGTWLTHRYPGARSDSDFHTFGYRFKAWTRAPIAPRKQILDYLGEVVAENGLRQHIRYGHRISSASWSSATSRWTVEAVRSVDGELAMFSANFLWMCQGYYRHTEGFTPEWKGMENFNGRIIHPQRWPEDLETEGKNVVVIGSGSTAATLIPAIAEKCGHITMLQRSPTYFKTGRNGIDLADTLRQLQISEEWIHVIVRRKLMFEQDSFVRRTFTEPEKVKQELIGGVRAALGSVSDAYIEKHFTPRYRPMQQRVAFVPDGDLFKAIKSGKASIVTDEIDRFTDTGLLLQSGQTLDADIIITATGFSLNVLGDIAFTIDNHPLDFAKTVTYRGMMFTGVPNMVWVFGYFRASWTLRVDLVADFVCRLLAHMKKKGARKVVPALRPQDKDMPLLPWIDPENWNPGYLMRGLHLLPKRGDKREWQLSQDFWAEKDELPAIDLDDAAFVYELAPTFRDAASNC